MTAQRRTRGTLAGAVTVLAAVTIGVVLTRGSDPAGSDPAGSDPAGSETSPRTDPGADTRTDAASPYCGASRYVEEITMQRWADGGFRVSVRPTPDARHAADRDDTTDDMWQAVRRCLQGFDGLDGAVGDSLQDQLRCHEYLALVPARGEEQYATGETYDLESWRPAPGRRRWLSTRCGNTLGTDPTSPPVQTYRPDGVQPERTVSGEQA